MDTTGGSTMECEEEEMKTLKLTPKQICIALFLVCGFFNVFTSFRTPLSDFGNYYYGAKLVSEGKSAVDLYDVMAFNRYAEEQGGTGLFLDHCTVAPQTTLLYQPFALIGNAQLAKNLFNWFGIVFFIFSFYRFLRRFNSEIDWKLCIVLIASLIPLYYNILFGQTYLIIAALLFEVVLNSEKLKWLSGICLAIAIALKISPAILIIWLLSERKFKVVGWTIGFWVFITWLNGALFFWMAHATIQFYAEAMPRMMNGFVSDPYSSSLQGFVVFLRKLMLPDAILNPHALINGTERLVQLINTLFFIGISVVLVGAWKNIVDWKKKILLLLLLVNITSGYTSTYSLLLMVPFISFGANSRHEFTLSDWIRVMLYAVVLMFPPRIFDGYSPFLEEYKLWIFIALFIMECKPTFSFKRLEKPQMLVAAILFAMVIFKFTNRPEVFPLKYYHPDLVHQDYVLDAYFGYVDGTITYVSYADGGFREYVIPAQGNWFPSDDVYQFIHGVTIRMIAQNEENMLVLSDYHRGPGLFHLYTISKSEFQSISGQ